MKRKVSKLKIFYFTTIILFLAISIFLGVNYYNKIKAIYNPTDILQVKEVHDISYQVFYKENKHYPSGQIVMDEYVHGYTDFIKLLNDYSAIFNEGLDAKYDYNVTASLIVRRAKSGSSSGNPMVWKKTYDKLESESGSFSRSTKLNKAYDIKLDRFFKDAEKYESTVNFPISAEVQVEFKMNLEGDSDRFKGSEYTRIVVIPLTNETYTLQLDNNKERTLDYNVPSKSLFTMNFFANSINIVLCYVIVFFAARGLIRSNNIYKETIKKYLKTYDDIIINTDSPIDFDANEVVTINEFKELLDLSGTTNNPIMFYENNQGGLFYIRYNEVIYLHIVRNM